MPAPHDAVWYLAYGSNLSQRRFACYLEGGRPDGADRTYLGCRDPSPALDDRPVALPFRVRFGGASRVWGGGLAFVDHTRTGITYGRAYLLRIAQFGDVMVQENALDVVDDDGAARLCEHGERLADELPRAVATTRPGEVALLADGNYGALVSCGTIDGRPALTFTSPGLGELPANGPAPAYLDVLVDGLVEAWGLTPAAALRWWLARPGASAHLPEAARVSSG